MSRDRIAEAASPPQHEPQQMSASEQLPAPMSASMVRAAIEGRKTMARWPMKPQPERSAFHGDVEESDQYPGEWFQWLDGGHDKTESFPHPYGQPGDFLSPAVAIPGLDDRYCADTHGDIWSRANGEWRRLRATPTGGGYLAVTPADGGKYKTRSVHTLVASAFYGHKPDGWPQVRHLDGVQTNNAPINLDWGDQSQNWTDRLVHGRGIGEEHHASKITVGIAAKIRASTLSQRTLARMYGVSQSQIWSVKSGRTWDDNPRQAPPNIERWATRTWLRVTGVRVERVQEITPRGVAAEGAPREHAKDLVTLVPRDAEWFRELWDSINAKRGYGWDKNPWCWCVSFERCEAPA